ncbi:hypothetical protein [Microseira sp. BLCC-F43]|jgi:hypothetical protein|uniref:hypothetical protein n=1 Tax=Microseira sp. BLCC-F43 TaxID=3153602 RepID=UPI0035B75601
MATIYQKTAVATAGALFIGFGIVETADAFLLTPLDSSIELGAKSEADGVVANDSAFDSQSGTVNLLSASVKALATSSNKSVTTTAEATAEWFNNSQGSINFSNIGWDIEGPVSGSTVAGANWFYSFTANENGTFILDFNVTGFSTSSLGTFGLNGWIFEWSGLGGNEEIGDSTNAFPNFPILGTIKRTVETSLTYTVGLRDRGANIASTALIGASGVGSSKRSGIFEWRINAAPKPASIPEPPSTLGILALGALGTSLLIQRIASSSRYSNFRAFCVAAPLRVPLHKPRCTSSDCNPL